MQDTIIIGGGLAGLSAALHLHRAGRSFTLLEAADRCGGRVQTDPHAGYLLDHGFQVMLTAYPECRALLDYEALDLKKFPPGAVLLQADGSRDRIGDPLRDLSSLFPTLTASVGGVADKLRILKLKTGLSGKDIDAIFRQKEKTTEAALREDYGFGNPMIERFFRPFFAGIFLERQLGTSRRMFDFVFKMFGEGYAAVPAGGMAEIPAQLVARLPAGSVKTGVRVGGIEGQTVITADGNRHEAKNILLATAAPDLVSQYRKDTHTEGNGTLHVHFSADKAPLKDGSIALNTLPDPLVNNICVISHNAPAYAPPGKHLISASVIGTREETADLPQRIKAEMKKWFGAQTDDWQHLHTRRIDYGLPDQTSVEHTWSAAGARLRPGLFYCGDLALNGSQNAALRSGRIVAEGILGQP